MLLAQVSWGGSQAGAAVSSEGSTGGGPASKLVHMPGGRILFSPLPGHSSSVPCSWLEVSLGSSPCSPFHRTNKVEASCFFFFCNPMVEVIAYHFCCILFIRTVARSSPHWGWGQYKDYNTRRWGSWGLSLRLFATFFTAAGYLYSFPLL